MNMKRIAIIKLGLESLGLASMANTDTDRLEKMIIKPYDDIQLSDLTFNLIDLRNSLDLSVIYNPLIRKRDNFRVLPQLIVNGWSRLFIFNCVLHKADDESIFARCLNRKE